MPDHRYAPGDPRHYDRADNAGFSIALAMMGFLALGVAAVAMSHDDSRAPSQATADQPAALSADSGERG